MTIRVAVDRYRTVGTIESLEELCPGRIDKGGIREVELVEFRQVTGIGTKGEQTITVHKCPTYNAKLVPEV
jgi:hypothetical protein